MKYLATLLVLPLLAATANASPLSDCYDTLIAKCTGDWGTATYRACVKGAMDHCDDTTPVPRDLGLGAAPPARQPGLAAQD